MKRKKCAHTHEVLSGINVSWSVNVSTRHRLKMNFYNNLRPRAPLTSNQPRPIDESPSSIEYWEARDSGYNFLNTFTIHRQMESIRFCHSLGWTGIKCGLKSRPKVNHAREIKRYRKKYGYLFWYDGYSNVHFIEFQRISSLSELNVNIPIPYVRTIIFCSPLIRIGLSN